MKSTIADVKQLFLAKAFATAGLDPDAIPDNTLGIIDMATYKTVAPANFGALPDEFRIISKVNGKTYYSFDTIKKASMTDRVAQVYKAGQVNIWEAMIESCSCIDYVQLNLGIDEASLIQQDGLTWTHMDTHFQVPIQELKCLCSCDGVHKVYENNVLTTLLVNKVNQSGSTFYKAKVKITAADGTGTAAPSGTTLGETYIRTGSTNPGFYVYDGTAWVQVGDANGIITDIDTFMTATYTRNHDANTTLHGPMMFIVIEGNPTPAGDYADLEPNYVYPRGIKLNPVLIVDGTVNSIFQETQSLVYELGHGYDLRAEEWDNMNHYTNINYRTQLSDGLQHPMLKYQFENGKTYNCITFEFATRKVEKNDGDTRLFGVLVACESGASSVWAALTNAFI